MLRLSRISLLPLEITQYFIYQEGTNKTPIPSLKVKDIQRNTNPSTIVTLNENHAVLKLIKPMKWVERFKFFWFRSRFSKEIRGNLVLQSLGIRVPSIYSRCYAVNPAGKYLGYLLMQDMEYSGNHNAQELLEQKGTNAQLRRHIIEHMIRDVRLMQKHNIVFTDLKLNNIYADMSGHITWIDTGINIYSCFTRNRFIAKNNFSVQRFLRIHKPLLSDQEVKLISNLLL